MSNISEKEKDKLYERYLGYKARHTELMIHWDTINAQLASIEDSLVPVEHAIHELENEFGFES